MRPDHTEPAAVEPVTVVITRRVKAGREAQYEAWLARLQAEARSLPGYLGVTTQRPAAGAAREYVSAIRFSSLPHLRAFETSEMRRRYLAEVSDLVEADAVWQRLTGLEFWFTGLVLSLGTLVNWMTGLLPVAVPYPLRLLLTITIEVLLMTYWLMPQLTRRLARWIYPGRLTVA